MPQTAHSTHPYIGRSARPSHFEGTHQFGNALYLHVTEMFYTGNCMYPLLKCQDIAVATMYMDKHNLYCT